MAIDQVVRDGPWPGSRTRLIDDTNLGESFFDVTDRATGRLLYSRGFGSIYGEWITTPEFHTANRTFQESLRFPWPKAAGPDHAETARRPERPAAVLVDGR